MAQACCSDRRKIRINRQDFPQVCICSAFEKLERKHMVYVLKCMAHITPKVRNIRAYALSTLYNSYLIFQRGPLSQKSRKKARKYYKNWRVPKKHGMSELLFLRIYPKINLKSA